VILSHGNAEDMGSLTGLAELISALGVSVLAYDYPGYGRSTGEASEASACDGIAAAYQYLVGQCGVAPECVILYGRSVGSGPTMWLASRESIGAVVLESAFVSAFRVLTRWSLFPFDRFPNLKRMRKLKCPLLVLHGEQDSIIAPWHSTALHAVARSKHKSLVVFNGAGHNDLQAVAGRDYPRVLRAFFASLDQIATH